MFTQTVCRRWRIAPWRTAVIAVLVVCAPGLVPLTVDAVSPEELDPLLRALSVRPWWGDPPNFALAGLDGRRQSLAGLKGQTVLLYFWATW
jgi:hypothetical protein